MLSINVVLAVLTGMITLLTENAHAYRDMKQAACLQSSTSVEASEACLKSRLSIDSILACGQSTNDTKAKIACFNSDMPPNSIKTCGRITHEVDVKIACFNSKMTAEEIQHCRNIAPSDPNKMISCLKARQQ